MFNQIENECPITHLEFVTQLLSWHPHYVLCLLRQTNAWNLFTSVHLHEFYTKHRNSRRFKNFQNFFQEISKKKQVMFNQLTNECSITHLDFFTQLLSWHPHYVLCLLRQRNAGDLFTSVSR